MKTWTRLLLAAIAATALFGFAAGSSPDPSTARTVSSPEDDLSSGCPCRIYMCQCAVAPSTPDR